MVSSASHILDRIEQICPVPATAQRVMVLCADPNAQIAKIADAVASDPGLSVEVMRIANSAAYGRARQVADLGQAILMMGLRELNQMATAMAMLAAFRSKLELSHDLHQTAVFAGSIARGLASATGGVDQGQAFVCGLLGEVGAMACLAVDGMTFATLLDEAGASLNERERLETERYGTTTRALGGQLLRRNGLPEEIVLAIEARPGPGLTTGLSKVSTFAREAAPAIVRMGKDIATEAGAAALERELAFLAFEIGMAIDLARLVEICVDAARRTLTAFKE